MDTLRIVMVGPFGLRPRGTMSARALPLARALARRGHQVVLLMPPWQNPEDAGRRWEEDGVTVENIALPARVPLLFHLLTALRLARRALNCQPDVVHLFKPKAYSGLVHWLLWRRPRRPRLVVDTDDWEGPGGWNELAPYSPAQRRFFAWQERWGLTHADAVTVASRTLQSLVWALGVPPDRVLYVPNGISPVDAGPRVAPPPPPTILLYTRFFEFPVERVVDLLQRVRRAMPAARLLVVGEGLFGEEERLLELARQNRLTEAIEYAGWAPEELARHFARAHLAIYPFDDTLINRTKCPAKLVELAAAGIPIVAEAVGEIAQTLRHGETGWLVEAGDVAGFAGAVVRLLEDAPLRERLGRAAAQDVQGRLAWERLAETVERAYGV